MISEGDSCIINGNDNAFGISRINVGVSLSWGSYGTPDIISAVRAHYYTRDEKYLKVLLGLVNYCTGANSINMCYTTGIGNYTRSLMHVDSRFTGQKQPSGITAFGPFEVSNWTNYWPYRTVFKPILFPSALIDWPNVDACTSVFPHTLHAEYTVHSTMMRTCLYFGYLAYLNSK